MHFYRPMQATEAYHYMLLTAKLHVLSIIALKFWSIKSKHDNNFQLNIYELFINRH